LLDGVLRRKRRRRDDGRDRRRSLTERVRNFRRGHRLSHGIRNTSVSRLALSTRVPFPPRFPNRRVRTHQIRLRIDRRYARISCSRAHACSRAIDRVSVALAVGVDRVRERQRRVDRASSRVVSSCIVSCRVADTDGFGSIDRSIDRPDRSIVDPSIVVPSSSTNVFTSYLGGDDRARRATRVRSRRSRRERDQSSVQRQGNHDRVMM